MHHVVAHVLDAALVQIIVVQDVILDVVMVAKVHAQILVVLVQVVV